MGCGFNILDGFHQLGLYTGLFLKGAKPADLSSLALIVFFKRTLFNALMNAIRAWFAVAAKARWANPAEIKWQFGGTVDFVGDNRVVFDLGGNKYRLNVHVSHTFGRVLVKFIGTHAEYDRIDPKTVSWRKKWSIQFAPKPTMTLRSRRSSDTSNTSQSRAHRMPIASTCSH